MLKGKTKAIVVSNYSPELEPLKKNKHIYFANTPLAIGVLEGITHYNIGDLLLTEAGKQKEEVS